MCFALLSIALDAYSQSYKDYQDVVYLNNGSIIRGVIIEQIPNKSLKIQTADGSVFVYEISDVLKITKERPVASSYTDKKNSNFSRRGYRAFVDVGGAIGVGDYGDAVFSISTSHGFQPNPYIFIGAGIGIDYHFDWEAAFLPIFADVRVYPLDTPITPFFGVKVGYSPVDGKGFYFNPAVGASFGIAKKFAMNVSVGYNMQMAKIEYWSPYYTYEENENIGGVSLKLGFEF